MTGDKAHDNTTDDTVIVCSSSQKRIDKITDSFMRSGPIGQAMWKLTYPLLISLVVSSVYIICDYLFIGKLSSSIPSEQNAILAIISLIAPLEQGCLHCFAKMINSGGSTLVSQFVGERDYHNGEMIIGNALVIQVIFSVIITVLISTVSRPLLSLIGTLKEETLEIAVQYIHILCCGTVFYSVSSSVCGFIRGQGAAVAACFISVISTAINVMLDPVLIKGGGYGLQGAAMATVITSALSMCMGLLFLRGKHSLIHIQISNCWIRYETVKKILMTGLPGLVSSIASSVVTTMSNILIVHFSPFAADHPHTSMIIASWGALTKISFITFIPLIALAQGLLPLLAFSYGAKLHKRFSDCVRYMFIWQMVLAVTTEVLIMVLAPFISGLFSNDQEFTDFFVPALRCVVSGVILEPLTMTVFPLLQSIGKGGEAGVLLLMKECIVLLGVQFGLSLYLGSYWGFVYAYPITEVISAFIALYYYRKSCWSIVHSVQLYRESDSDVVIELKSKTIL